MGSYKTSRAINRVSDESKTNVSETIIRIDVKKSESESLYN